MSKRHRVQGTDQWLSKKDLARLERQGHAKLCPDGTVESALFTREPDSRGDRKHEIQAGHNRFAATLPRPYRSQSDFINTSPEYLHWRESVLKRDGYKCVWCASEFDLHADHIKPKSIYPDLAYDVANGRTLCAPCHRQTDTYGKRSSGISVVEEITL